MSALVLHVLPLDLPRGAQRYAKAMRDALDGPTFRHRTLTLFASSFRALDADIKLDVERSRFARLGLEPRVLLALRAALQREAPSVVVAHGSEPLKYLFPLVPAQLPLVYYKIGVANAKALRGFSNKLHTTLLRRPERVAGVSHECLDEAASAFGVPRAKLVLIPNGRDPETFRPAAAPDSEAIPRLTFLGHFAPTKRPGWFIEVVAKLRASGARFTAAMIGDGPLLTELERAARDADVELLGHRDDVPELLRQSSVLAFTSVPSGEGMPGVFIEAGLCGVPVVSTEVPGARTVIVDGQSGHVVPHDDIETFTAHVRSLLVDREQRLAMGRAARDHCLAEFTLQRSAELWRQLLVELAPHGQRAEERA